MLSQTIFVMFILMITLISSAPLPSNHHPCADYDMGPFAVLSVPLELSTLVPSPDVSETMETTQISLEPSVEFSPSLVALPSPFPEVSAMFPSGEVIGTMEVVSRTSSAEPSVEILPSLPALPLPYPSFEVSMSTSPTLYLPALISTTLASKLPGISASATVSTFTSMSTSALVSPLVIPSNSVSTSSSASESITVSSLKSMSPSVSGSKSPAVSASVSASPLPRPSKSLVPLPSPSSIKSPTPSLSSLKSSSFPSPGPHLKRGCVWNAENDGIKIPMGTIKPYSFWSKRDRGIEWRRGNDSERVDPRGVGILCFPVKFKMSGTYYVTAHTRSEHGTEHNDMFLRFGGGLEFYDAGTWRKKQPRDPMDFFKVYQNDRGLSEIISTVDRDPHVLISKRVVKGKIRKLCISGRSSLFVIYSLEMVRCTKEDCKRSSSVIRDRMRKLKRAICK